MQKKIINFLYVLVAFTIPYGFFYKVNNIAIIVLLLVSLFFFLKEKSKSKEFDLFLLLPIIYFFLLFTTVLYSKDVSFAFKQLEKSITFLALPIAVMLNRRYFSKQLIANVIAAFVVSNVMGLLFCYILGFLDFHKNVLPITKGSFYLTGYINIHPSYFSMYLVFCFGICVHFFNKNYILTRSIILRNLLQSAVYVFIAFSIFFLKSRAGLISFAILLVLLLFRKLKKKSHQLVLLVLMLILGFFFSLFNHELFTSLLNRDTENAINERMTVWQSAFKVVDDAILFGHGLGNSKQVLDKQFYIDGFDTGIDMAYNAHSQYLETLLSGGITLLLVVLSMLGVFFIQYKRTKNIVFLACFISLLIGMFFESILVRQHGIVFFSFFYSVFCIKIISDNRDEAKIKEVAG